MTTCLRQGPLHTMVLCALGAMAPRARRGRWRRAFGSDDRRAPLLRLLQADAVLYRQSARDEINSATGPLNTQRFSIPRARLRADFERGPVAAALELDANTLDGPAARILDAEITGRWQGRDPKAPPYLALTIGLLKVPFGLEVPQAETAGSSSSGAPRRKPSFPASTISGSASTAGIGFFATLRR